MIAELAAITLLCEGVADVAVSDTAEITTSDGFNTRNSTATTDRLERVPDRAWVEISGGIARIKPPRSIAPPISRQAVDGWRPVIDLVVTDERITGALAFNWLNKPAFTINRMTGEIDLRSRNPLLGATGFSGQCRPVETNERLF